MITNIRTLSLVVLATLALALSACGGGGGNGPVTDEPMPAAVNLDDVAANAMRPATDEPIVIAPGQSIVHGDVAFLCAAGGPACMVTVAGDGTASSTGGMVTATNSEAYAQRVTVANAIGMAETAINALSLTSSDAEVAAVESLLAAAKTALEGATALSMVDRDALNGRIQTVETTLGEVKARIAHALSELEQAILEISAAIDEAEFRTAALSRTSSDTDVIAVEALLANLRTALDAFPPPPGAVRPAALLDPLYWRLQIVEMTLASIKTDIATHRAAVANVIDMAANNNRQDELGEFVGGWWRREPGIGGQQASVTRSYDGGGSVNVILSHDESGQLQHNVAIFQNNSYQLVETTDIRVRMDRVGRYINTYEDPQELEGVTRSTRSISDHGLGAEWQVTELTSEYDGGGTLNIQVATDLEPTNESVDPFANLPDNYGNIEFSGAPALPDDQDFLVVRFPYGIIVEGVLDGVAGYFDCPAGWCYLSIDRRSRGYYAVSAGLAFTPEGGTAQPVPTLLAGTPPATDYLAFGHWLYVPEDAAEPDDVPPTLGYDFGVFASGGDPFTAANLRALTGTATYEGDSAGMYYVGGLSGTPDVGSFTADVELTADFGSNVETGTIGGQVSNFEFEGDVASSLPETVTLASRTYDYLLEGFGVAQGTTDNIFDTSWRDEVAPYPGGWVGGRTQASVGGQNWYGSWSGAFYGNGTATTDHPTSVAGEFGSYPWGDGNHNQRDTGLTGSFGAHRQGTGAMPIKLPDGPFTLQPGTERQLSAEVFLVCPSRGSPCHIQSVIENEHSEFDVQLASGSDRPFFWNSTIGLFSGNLSPYEHKKIQLVGSSNTHIITCAQSAPCVVSNLHYHEDRDSGIIKWRGSEHVHVSDDETGFFLLGSKTVAYPDGKSVIFSCPNGCGIDRIFINSHGNYAYHYNKTWERPELRFASHQDDSGAGKIWHPQDIPPPVLTSHYAHLPKEFPKFPVDHWELQDTLAYHYHEPDNLLRSEVICPGLEHNGQLCTIRDTPYTIDFVLDELEGKIVAVSPPNEHGFIVFGPDLLKLNIALGKKQKGQPLSVDEQALLDGFQAGGQWGNHSVFGYMLIPDHELFGGSSLNYFAFGDLYGRRRGGKPEPVGREETATWRGEMTATWHRDNDYNVGGLIFGTSQLVYHFSRDEGEVDLMLAVERDSADQGGLYRYAGPTTFGWARVDQNGDGSFFINGNHKEGLHPDLENGMLDGDFYGLNAEEVAGIFERFLEGNHIRGEFGGSRVADQ